MLEVQALFKKQFGHTPTHTVQAPGRLELLGNHTDYNQGLVLALAVDRYVFMGNRLVRLPREGIVLRS